MRLKRTEEITLTNLSPEFEGTSLQNEAFSITIKRLNRSEKLDILFNSLSKETNENGDTIIDQKIRNANNFVFSISDFSGFEDEEGIQLEVTDENKALLYETIPEQLYNAINKATDKVSGVEEIVKKPVSDISQTEQPTENHAQSV